MIPRITSIENLIASDPGGRNVFGLVIADQLRLAAQSLRLARRVGIVSGFYVADPTADPPCGAPETDGPGGAKVVGEALRALNIDVDFITDELNADAFRAIGLTPRIDIANYLDEARPTHLLAIERVGRGRDGRYRNMRGQDITSTTAPLDELFLEGSRRGLTTIGIGDGGNEIGMAKVFSDTLAAMPHGREIATTVATDFCIAAGVSNWGAYGLAGALCVLVGRDLLPTAEAVARDIERLVSDGGAVDGVTMRSEATVDGLDLGFSLRMLEDIRRQTSPSPLIAGKPATANAEPATAGGKPITIGVLGYGESGRAACDLARRGHHRVCISDSAAVMLDAGTVVAGVESGGHSIEFLQQCDLIVASPGVRADAPIRNELHRRGIPVMSEIEFAFQHCRRRLIAVTGTIGKRTTVELIERLFDAGGGGDPAAGQRVTIGGNRGRPLSAILGDENDDSTIAVAVSSFQLETVVGFRPDVAILLNISEAHLDRHRSIAEYVRVKSRIFMNQRPTDALILPFDDPRTRALARKCQGRLFFISARHAVDRGAWLAGGELFANIDGTVERFAANDPPFPENLLSAVVAARLSGVTHAELTRAIASLDASDLSASDSGSRDLGQ